MVCQLSGWPDHLLGNVHRPQLCELTRSLVPGCAAYGCQDRDVNFLNSSRGIGAEANAKMANKGPSPRKKRHRLYPPPRRHHQAPGRDPGPCEDSPVNQKAAQNSWILPWRAVETSRVRRRREVSSACWWRGGAGHPSGRLMDVICPRRVSCLRWAAKGCAFATCKSGGRGLPCAKPELTGKEGGSHPLYRTLHCSPSRSRDTQRRAAGPKASVAMHMSTQCVLVLSYTLEK